jgi:cation-transporting ATPase E
MLLLRLEQAGALQPQVTQQTFATTYSVALPVAQTSLTTFLVLCGLLLVVFSAPPSRWWEAAEALSTDLRPAMLAAGLALAFVAICLTPPLAALFTLVSLGPLEVGLVAMATGLWLVLVRETWRRHWLARFLGLDESRS